VWSILSVELQNIPWARKHDLPGVPLIPTAPRVAYPTSLEEVIALCRTRAPDERLHAAGSHWGLSRAAVSDNVFVETHDPNNAFPAMGRTLYEVVPGCLAEPFIKRLAASRPEPYDEEHVGENVGLYPVHMETGKRVYQAYAEMDFGEEKNPQSLAYLLKQRPYGNSSYAGPWAFRTLGGAGGQTVFGALTTGTHGGDFRQPPIADSVLALHLVVDGGKHYWIERSVSRRWTQMTDDDKLRTLYGDPKFGGPDNFEIRRDDNLFKAVLISAGRFGIVYSIVVGAVRQYSLHEERRLRIWQDIKALISDPTSELYVLPSNHPASQTAQQKFLQIAVCLTTHENFTRNLAGVTKRWNVPMAVWPGTQVPIGRDERRGDLADSSNPIDPQTGALGFTRAGQSYTFSPNPADPDAAAPPSLLERACSNGDFMIGVIETVIAEIRQFIHTNTVPIGGAIAAVAAIGGVSTLLALLAPLAVILSVLLAFLAAMAASGNRFGETLNELKDSLLNRADPGERAAGIFAWQCIAFKIFEDQQKNQDYEAISYAVMDGHNYRDQSCNFNVESVEVFFDAKDPMLVAFVDALIAFEARQEFSGKAFMGYASVRFTAPTEALIGPEKAPLTCVVEVAGLADVAGSTELVAFAETLARNPNFNGILHWGQRNNATVAEIERWFGDRADAPGGPLGSWRSALAMVTLNGRLEGFSSAFTRRTGLEVLQPVLGSLTHSPQTPAQGDVFTIRWDSGNNPPETEVALQVTVPDGTTSNLGVFGLTGSLDITSTMSGTYWIKATAVLTINGLPRSDSRHLQVVVS
jgi:hypothetical protein